MLAQVLNPSIWRGLSHTLAWARHQLGKPIISSAAPAAAATLISVLHVFSVLAGYRVGGIAQPQRIASGTHHCNSTNPSLARIGGWLPEKHRTCDARPGAASSSVTELPASDRLLIWVKGERGIDVTAGSVVPQLAAEV